jgi:ectoine hydroxylase-related dioxygenase (phytanoyl-CoA dioxygenase family)
MNAELFKKQGYIVIENFISNEDVRIIKDICYSIKQKVIQNDLIGKEKDFGLPTYWRGIEMASTQSPILYEYYTSQKMYNMSSQLLNTQEVYLFNDQIVVKLPEEDFNFSIHTDNSLGPNNNMALSGKFKTITSCIVLDDFTQHNGPISILNKTTKNWDTPLPKKGDMIVWDGNTFHKSENNISEVERSVWLCIYSTTDLTNIQTTKGDLYKRFYGKKFLTNML